MLLPKLNLTLNLTLKLKLIFTFVGMILIFIAVAAFNLYQVNLMKNQLDQQNNKVDLKLQALDLKVKVQELKDISSGLMISRNTEYVEKFTVKRKEFNDLVKKIGDTAVTGEQQQWRGQMIMAAVVYLETFDRAVKVIENHQLTAIDIQKNTESLYNESQIQRDTLFDLVDHFYVDYGKGAQAAVNGTYASMNHTVQIMIIASVIFLTITVTLSIFLIRSFIVPIRKLQHAMIYIASGDLRHKINSIAKDELGQLSNSFDKMIDQVRGMLGQTQQIAASLSDHSQSFHQFSKTTADSNQDILKAISEISTGADQQASQSEQSTHLIAELEQEIADILQYTEGMQLKSKEAEAHSELGTSSVHELSLAAKQSEQKIADVVAAMQSLSASSNQIGKIVNTITDISIQTNVLALNAAIEAARAGEHGKGFSVIADEVRMLSQQTNASSKNIANIIQSLQQQMTELEHHMQNAQEGLLAQNTRVDETLNAFSAIRGTIKEVIKQIGHIHLRIDQAKTKNMRLVESVQFVAAVAEETAAGIEEVNSTSIQQDASIHRIAIEADDIYLLSKKLFAEINKFQVNTIEIMQENADERELVKV